MKFQYQGFHIPERMMPGLLRYTEHGIHPGNFLHAVLCNDLRGACTLGDEENLRNLPAFVAYLYSIETPIGCWGSASRVADWIAQHAAQREGTSP